MDALQTQYLRAYIPFLPSISFKFYCAESRENMYQLHTSRARNGNIEKLNDTVDKDFSGNAQISRCLSTTSMRSYPRVYLVLVSNESMLGLQMSAKVIRAS